MVATYLRQHLLKPPFPLLPLAVFAYVAACFLLHPLSPLRSGELADPDDYMRLVQVGNWLQGQGWFDLTQPRLSPGAGTIIHWARLVDLPLALVMWPLAPLLGIANAGLIASLIVPLVWLGCALALASALAEIVVGAAYANLSSLLLLFAPMTVFNLSPGRAGHHGPQILVAGFGLLCFERIVADKQATRYAIAVAFSFAAGLWMGTEGLPWLLVFIACLAAASVWMGDIVRRNAAMFGVAFAVATTLIIPLALAPADYGSRALSWFSPAYAILAALSGAVLVLFWALARLTNRRGLHIALMLALSGCAAMIFAALVPDILRGPFADYDAFDATTALSNITEAQPLLNSLRIDWRNHLGYGPALVNFIRALLPALIALQSCAIALSRPNPPHRALWLAQIAFLLSAIVLTVFWQVRVGWFMQFFAVMPLTWLLVDYGCRFAPPRRIMLYLLLAPIPVLLVPAAYYNAPLTDDVLLYPAARNAKACEPHRAADFMTAGWYRHPQVVLASANDGPEILFRTPHSVIAGNFNVPGNRDVFDFFNARDEGTAHAIIDKWGVGLVLVCQHISPFYADYDKPRVGGNVFLQPGRDGKLELGGDPRHRALIERLVNADPPDWLKPIEIPGETSYFLYEVTTGHSMPRTGSPHHFFQ